MSAATRAASLLVCIASAALAQVPVRVKDINTVPRGSNPRSFTAMGGATWFFADEGSGAWLWRSDGTVPGTVRVAGPLTSPGPLTALGPMLYFSAVSPGAGVELWRSDGTAAGTALFRDIHPTSSSSPARLVAAGSSLFFWADDGTGVGSELWRSDGTAAGTVRVADVTAGATSSNVSWAVAVGSTLFFVVNLPSIGSELWKSDGTAAGTANVLDIVPGTGSSFPRNLVELGGTLFFVAGAASGIELWRSDGTAAGTAVVRDIIPGNGSSAPSSLTVVGPTLFFVASDGTSGVELWKTDGTGPGTQLVRDINPGGADSSPSLLTAVGSTLFFSANDGVRGAELWKSDGTTAGTVLVRDIYPGAGSSSLSSSVAYGGALYFAANDSVFGVELWKSDGTDAGTALLKDLFIGGTANGSLPAQLTVVEDTLFFLANGGTGTFYDLWKTDGTAPGTVRVKDLPLLNTTSLVSAAAVGPNLFFSVTEGPAVGLWRSDGTDSGTRLVAPIPFTADSGRPSPLSVSGGLVLFPADDGMKGRELCRSNGSDAGSFCFDLVPGPAGAAPGPFAPLWIRAASGKVFFAVNDSDGDQELWVLDVDATPPVISDQLAGTRTDAGWFVSNVDVGFTVTDPESPIGFELGCGPAMVTSDTSGTTFVCRAGSEGGFSSRSVTVRRDATPPVVTCGPISAEAMSPSGASVGFDAGVADAIDPAPVLTYSPASGSTFPLGSTPVVATGTDQAGNRGVCMFPVGVVDTLPPLLASCPDHTAQATSPAGTPVDYPGVVASDLADPAPAVTYSRSPGSVFPLGATAVTAVATDASGNAAMCTFTVTTVDTRPPTVVCPADVKVLTPDGSAQTVSFPPATATDNADADPTLRYSHAPGSEFPLGPTQVTVTAEDDAGYLTPCAFLVVVECSTPECGRTVIPRSHFAFGCSASGSTVLALLGALWALRWRRRPATKWSRAST